MLRFQPSLRFEEKCDIIRILNFETKEDLLEKNTYLSEKRINADSCGGGGSGVFVYHSALKGAFYAYRLAYSGDATDDALRFGGL